MHELMISLTRRFAKLILRHHDLKGAKVGSWSRWLNCLQYQKKERAKIGHPSSGISETLKLKLVLRILSYSIVFW